MADVPEVPGLVDHELSAPGLRCSAITSVPTVVVQPLPEHLHTAVVELWREVGLTRPWNDPGHDLRRAVAGPASTVLAAIDDDRLVGTVMAGHDGHRGWVYYLAVAPAAQRAGVGRQLMAAAERWLAPQVPKVQLMVRRENATAVAFYERLGYSPSDVEVLSRWIDGR